LEALSDVVVEYGLHRPVRRKLDACV
jgi:hypothetical protein